MEYETNNKKVHTIQYDHYNIITKKIEQLCAYVILTKNISEKLRSNKIYEYFGDAIYRFVPPTFRSFKLYVISGFNI